MFDSFSQENSTSARLHGGLGLGLMIVRHLVEAHGGCVRAETLGRGRGASFFVDLPLSEGTVAAGTTAGERPQEREGRGGLLTGLRAVVVEDHADSREFVRTVLQHSGAEVQDVGSAGEALALLTASGADIVISDLGMPEVDGYAFLRSLRQIEGPGRDVPVIALSAFAGAEDRERALAAGFRAYAAKPIDPRQLVHVVAQAVGRPA
jgi:CheY-like chemotaxis protein